MHDRKCSDNLIQHLVDDQQALRCHEMEIPLSDERLLEMLCLEHIILLFDDMGHDLSQIDRIMFPSVEMMQDII
jgi:hypothetical protein